MGEDVCISAQSGGEASPATLLPGRTKSPLTPTCHTQPTPMQTERVALKHDASNFDDYMLLMSLIALVGFLVLL